MKKSSLVILALMLSLFVVSGSFAGQYAANGNGNHSNGAACCLQDHAGEGQCVCYRPFVRYKPVPYCTTRCEQEAYTVQKRCCRYRTETYTKEHCRQVPEYYTQTHCRQVPQYYTVCEQKCAKRYVKEQHCRYVPQTYMKKVCTQQQGDAPGNCDCDPCKEYNGCGPVVCWCPMVRYVPQHYCTTRCEDVPYTVQKRCCRYVPEQYETKHCRYRTEKYCTQHCRQVPEYYNVCETRYRPKYVKEQHCRYVPQTYYKKVYCPNPCGGGCGTSGGCAAQ